MTESENLQKAQANLAKYLDKLALELFLSERDVIWLIEYEAMRRYRKQFKGKDRGKDHRKY